jgi:hypothetical protein
MVVQILVAVVADLHQETILPLPVVLVVPVLFSSHTQHKYLKT